MSGDFTLEVNGETFWLLPERLLFWPKKSLLVAADVHLGKSETFQMHGLWLPSEANHQDLERLKGAALRVGARDLLFLGDLVHSLRGVSPELIARFSNWIAEWHRDCGGQLFITIGNHDVHLHKQWPKEWEGLQRLECFSSGGILFQHEPLRTAEPKTLNSQTDFFYWVGHIHPTVTLTKGPDRIRLPCFVIEKRMGILPAFSSLAGGQNQRPNPMRRIFALAAHRVFEV